MSEETPTWQRIERAETILSIVYKAGCILSVVSIVAAFVISWIRSKVPVSFLWGAGLWLLGIALGFAAARLRRRDTFLNPARLQQAMVHNPAFTIDGTSYGWRGPTNNFEKIVDGTYGYALRVKTWDFVDRDIEAAFRSCKTIEFIIKPDASGYKAKEEPTVYANVKVLSSDRSTSKQVWLNMKEGTQAPHEILKDVEWTVFVSSTRAEGGYISLKEHLPTAVQKTFGRDGWTFEQVIGIRLRGPLNMAKTNFYD